MQVIVISYDRQAGLLSARPAGSSVRVGGQLIKLILPDENRSACGDTF
jgi:hypothetical protein